MSGERRFVLTAGEIAAAMGGRLRHGDPATVIDAFSIDSRTLQPGDLFIALRGERFDGADYAQACLDAGASGVVVPPATGAWPRGEAVVIEVADTTAALQDLARDVRRRSGAIVVAITGSAGKTSTKEATAAFLDARFAVFKNPGNLNNHIGLPLSLLELRRGAEVAVVELGMNHAGEISRLVAIAAPDIRVWTNVGNAHLGFFDSVDHLADAKAEVMEGAGPSSVLVAGADDPLVMARARRFAGRIVRFGTAEAADVRATEVASRGLTGTTARVTTPVGTADLRVPLVGRGQLLNTLAAAAVALTLGVPLADVVDRAGRLTPMARRGEVVRAGGVTLVDDSYNSSPSALAGMLDAVAAEPAAGRRVAALGEMLELGAFARALHEEAGRAVAGAGITALVAVGGDHARAMADAAVAAGLPAEAVCVLATSAEAAESVARTVRAGDVVLVKGSRGIRMDVVADRLRAGVA